MAALMPFSRRPRNRYRRRPSRLTALGKAVVGATAFAFLALGWASQASRRPTAAESEHAIRPVSAPPRLPAAPSFGALLAPEPPAPNEARPAETAEGFGLVSALDGVGPIEPAEALPDGSSPAAPAPIDPLAPATHVRPEPGSAAAAGRVAPPRVNALRLGTPPTSRTRFERARPGSPENAARPLPSAALASLAQAPSDSATPVSAFPVATASMPEAGRPHLVEWADAGELGLSGLVVNGPPAPGAEATHNRVRIDYSLDEALTAKVFDVLRQGRVERGIAIVIDPRSGRVLAYATTDANVLPVERAYPAASIVKVVTAAAMLDQRPNADGWDCLYEGNKYRLSERRLDRPKRGNRATLEDALATSNNQCFSQWAIHGLGEPRLRRMLERFGWTARPAPGHAIGRVDPALSRYDLGQLGSGLDGVRVTPLHVASLASVLADGRLVAPRWIDRVVDARGREIVLPPAAAPERVISAANAENLRELLVATTKRGTARRAFRTRRGVPVLGSIEVAGKTGNLNGRDPTGRYEWFFGVAPASRPTVGVVVMQVHGHLWWARSSELAANILRSVFCEGSACRPELAARYTAPPTRARAPSMLVSDTQAR